MTTIRFLAALALLGVVCLTSNPAAASPAATAGDRCGPAAGREVITREDIAHAGMARLSDIFRLSDRWYAYSVDGYTWHAQVSGLSPASNPRWALVIDGMPVELGLLGIKNLDSAPIQMNEIACIVMTARPTVTAGGLRQSGTIDIRTRRPDSRAAVELGVSAGNEINDPGPFAYTSLASPNIDRIGPIGTGAVEFRAPSLTARISGKLDEYHTTDPQMNRRVRQLYEENSNPHIDVRGAALTAAFDARRTSGSVLIGRTTAKDLLFFETFGLEIPAAQHIDYLGGAGSISFGGAEMRYRGGYLSHELARRTNTEEIELNLRTRRISGGLETHVRSGRLSFSGGGSFDIVDAYSKHAISDPRAIVTQIFGAIGGTVGNRFEATIHGAWIQADDRPAFAMYHSSHVTLTDEHWAHLTATLARHTISMDETLWRWTRLGYTLPPRPSRADEPPASEIRDLPSAPAPRLGTVDLEIGGRFTDGLRYTVSGFYRRSLSDYVARHEMSFSEASTGFLTNTRLLDGVSGAFAGVSCNLALRLSRRWSQQLSYIAEGAISGHEAYESVHTRTPSQRVAYTMTYSPVDRFSLFVRARYHAGTVWQDFHAVAEASGDFYPAELSDAFLIDLAATKRLWKDHLVANISLRNVLNESYRAHPAGAIFDMSFHFSVRAMFNSERGS